MKIKNSNFIRLDIQGNVILEFTSYIPANNKIQIRGVDVKRFGLDSSRSHSVVDKYTFLLIKKSTRSGWLRKKRGQPRPARLIFLVYLYMGYLNGQSYLDKAQKREKGEKGQGFALTPDRHFHLNNKGRLFKRSLT